MGAEKAEASLDSLIAGFNSQISELQELVIARNKYLVQGHLFVEVLLFAVIVFLFSQKSYKPPKKPLTEKEIDDLCEEWVPEPLIPPITEDMQYEPPVLESAAGPHTIVNGKEVVNFASANYLGLIGHEKLLEDEGVHWGIQNGLHLSRSTIVYFKHNDMESLRNTLEEITLKNKRAKKLLSYIVVEAVYQEKYRFHVLLDESNSFGVLGKAGRGLTEFCGVLVEKIDIITAAMGHALAAEGGFCSGSARVTDHQRLSSSGYVFSASLPPYLASATITAIDVLEENPDLITKLKKNITLLWKGLSGVMGVAYIQEVGKASLFFELG
ncbi:hypothetical protein ABKV19_023931 [Rosa sericea]